MGAGAGAVSVLTRVRTVAFPLVLSSSALGIRAPLTSQSAREVLPALLLSASALQTFDRRPQRDHLGLESSFGGGLCFVFFNIFF